jgi:hypothetical protein
MSRSKRRDSNASGTESNTTRCRTPTAFDGTPVNGRRIGPSRRGRRGNELRIGATGGGRPQTGDPCAARRPLEHQLERACPGVAARGCGAQPRARARRVVDARANVLMPRTISFNPNSNRSSGLCGEEHVGARTHLGEDRPPLRRRGTQGGRGRGIRARRRGSFERRFRLF